MRRNEPKRFAGKRSAIARHDGMPSVPRHGLARVLSKLGVCSRTQAAALINGGRVRINGTLATDPEMPTDAGADRIELDGVLVEALSKYYLMLNKPRGLLTTTSDERGRDTVYSLLQNTNLPWIAPVGRLDKASEGLLLFSNDSAWAAALMAPDSKLDKTYHVQIDRRIDDRALAHLRCGVVDAGEKLVAKHAALLRQGEKNCWLEIVLDEGRNRQIRRLLAAFEIGVLRLVRVAIGPLLLGDLGKGQWRFLSEPEVAALAASSASQT
jgi:23S rRNA pseudouridine2605 synthase